MKVDRQAILHVARLAQLELDESQIKHYESQLKKILSYIAKLEDIIPSPSLEKEVDNPRHPQQQSCVGNLDNPRHPQRQSRVGDLNVKEVSYEREDVVTQKNICLLYTSPSPRDQRGSRMPSSA